MSMKTKAGRRVIQDSNNWTISCGLESLLFRKTLSLKNGSTPPKGGSKRKQMQLHRLWIAQDRIGTPFQPIPLLTLLSFQCM